MTGRTTARGYNGDHKRLRRAWAPRVATGTVTCAACGQPIQPGQAWDLGHVPGSGKTMWRGPEHAACNRDTANERNTRDPKGRGRTKW